MEDIDFKLPSNIRILEWSSELKHPDIEITDHVATRSHESKTGSCCVLADINLNSCPEDKLSWQIYIERIDLWILLGVCVEDATAQLNYEWDILKMSKPHHGQYLLGNNGVTFNHMNMMENDKKKDFKFSNDETLEFMVNRQKFELTISKDGTVLHRFKVPELGRQDKVVRPVAWLWQTGDKIKILTS